MGYKGPLAHLVERRVCIAEVTGSSPVGSTSVLPDKHSIQKHPFGVF